ncbi:hypothetical protein Tco_1399491, partial [Tanacetum coccineum]
AVDGIGDNIVIIHGRAKVGKKSDNGINLGEMVSMVSQAALAEAGLVLIILFPKRWRKVPFEKVTPCGVVRFLKIEFFGYETIDVMYRVEFFNQGKGRRGGGVFEFVMAE